MSGGKTREVCPFRGILSGEECYECPLYLLEQDEQYSDCVLAKLAKIIKSDFFTMIAKTKANSDAKRAPARPRR